MKSIYIDGLQVYWKTAPLSLIRRRGFSLCGPGMTTSLGEGEKRAAMLNRRKISQ
jgi:hypothetical protein